MVSLGGIQGWEERNVEASKSGPRDFIIGHMTTVFPLTDLSYLSESVPIFDGVHVMKQVKKTSKFLASSVFSVLISLVPTLYGDTKIDFSGAEFLNVNVNVTHVTYAPIQSEFFLLVKPVQY